MAAPQNTAGNRARNGKKRSTGIYARGNRLWCRLKVDGKWESKPTPFNVGQEREAKRFRQRAQANIDKREATGESAPLTVKSYSEAWLKEREERGIRSVADERSRLKHALPHIGSVRLDQLDSEQVRDLVRALRKTALAPRSIHHVYSTLHNMFENAEIEGKVSRNPIKVKRGELPKKRDADPEWRALATFTTDEVERLISDPALPVERRVMYALKALAGLRHGEAAALRWRHYQKAQPLGRLTIAVAWDSNKSKEKSTKTETSHGVPVHPALAQILAAWKLSHWARIYGRQPTADDLIVPTRTMRPVNKTDAARAMKEDLRALGLRIEAGKTRSRGGHDLRAWFQTQTVEDGADSVIIDRVTHAPPATVAADYSRYSWKALCREVSKLSISAESRGEVLEFATAFATAEKKLGIVGEKW
jgi:integrase